MFKLFALVRFLRLTLLSFPWVHLQLSRPIWIINLQCTFIYSSNGRIGIRKTLKTGPLLVLSNRLRSSFQTVLSWDFDGFSYNFLQSSYGLYGSQSVVRLNLFVDANEPGEKKGVRHRNRWVFFCFYLITNAPTLSAGQVPYSNAMQTPTDFRGWVQ